MYAFVDALYKLYTVRQDKLYYTFYQHTERFPQYSPRTNSPSPKIDAFQLESATFGNNKP